MKILSKRQIITLHSALINNYGGIDGLRSEELLDSSVNNPFQSFGGEELYPSLIEKAARLCYGLIKNHPFIDGNKRIGTHAMLVFLAVNDIFLSYEDNELIQIILNVASGNKNCSDLLNWIREHIA